MKTILTNLYKQLAGNLEFFIRRFSYPKDELIVLCMHSTPEDHAEKFRALVHFLLKYFKPIHPNQLQAYFKGELKDGPYLLFTFDDGLKNNAYAAQILEEHHIRALFFLVPDFIRATDQKGYYLENIRQVIDPSFDKLYEDFTALTEVEIHALISSGHAVGSHTMTHLLRSSSGDEQVFREVEQSKMALQEITGVAPDSFCSPIDTLFSISAGAKKLVRRNYAFHFTTFPGLNAEQPNPQLIFRRNIEVNWSKAKIKFALGAWDLARWLPRVKEFQQR